MSSNRRIRRDDFDIESIETFHDRGQYKSRSSSTRRSRSRSRKRSYSRRHDHDSRSRSRSLERSHRKGHDSYSRIHSRSRSRSYSRRSDKRSQASRRHRDSKSRSYSRSPSRHHSDHYRYRRERKRRSSLSRSRSRSSSQLRDCGTKALKTKNHSCNKPSTSSALLASVSEQNNDLTDTFDNIEDLPLPEQQCADKKLQVIYQFDENEPIDRERIHREMEEKLRTELAKEGKVYPPPKPEASHPVFANDGSFLEIFKKMQQAQGSTSTASASTANVTKPILPIVPPIVAAANPSTAPYLAAAAAGKTAPPPIVGRRRGGKILKTGVVAKPKIQTDANADPKDFWSLYLAEVNKYKNTACESEQGNRPLVK